MSLCLLYNVHLTANAHPEYEPPYGEKIIPKPFKYGYGLHSSSSDADFSKNETQ